MAFRLKKVTIQNFGTVRSSNIIFPDYGMVLVRGINECARGKMEAIGAGKTLAGEAISRTCFNVLGRFTNYGDFSNDHTGNKNTLVEVEGTLDGKPIAIRSGYKHKELNPTGEGLAYRLGDGDWTSRGHLSDTRTELSNLLGVTPEVASWTVYVDGDQLNFSALGQTKLVDLVLAALNQPPWTEYAEKANGYHRRIVGEMEAHEDRLNEVKRGMEAKKRDLESARADYKREKADYDRRAEEARAALESLGIELMESQSREAKYVDKKKKIKKEIKAQEEAGAEAFVKFENEKLEIKSRLTEARRVHAELVDRKSDAKSEVRRLKRTIEDAEALPDKCPTCHQPWDHTHDKKEARRVKNELAEAEEVLADKTRLVDESQEKIDALTVKLDKLDKSMAEKSRESTQALSDEFDEWDQKLRVLLRNRENLIYKLERTKKVPDQEVLNAKYYLDQASKAVEAAEDELRDAGEKFSATRKAASISAYLRTAFGPTGIPNMVLQEAITPLNESSRLISARMTGNSIAVSYSTTKELVSGKTRSELLVKTENKFGSKRLKGSSKGESGITSLIVAETIAEMSNVSARVAYRWYDEVLRNPDETMRSNFFAYVADLAKRKKILCFVVDHGQQAANYADYILVAHKTPEGTTYHWS